MLHHLLIKNYALIQHLELSPDASLNIITGETGAGKSIILGAIGLLLGNRMDTKALYNPNEKCLIEGHFDVSNFGIKAIFDQEELDYEAVCVIRREISPLGKSRAFVNDTPVNLETLKRIGENLIDVHSQTDTLALASNEYQLGIVDTYAQNSDELKAYSDDYQQFIIAKLNMEALERQAKLGKKDFDYNNFLFEEISKSKLVLGELTQIEQELELVENAEDVKVKLEMTAEYLYNADNSAIDYLEEAASNLSSISGFSENFLSLKNRLQSTIIELKDIFREVELALKSVDVDKSNIENLQSRINLYYNLFQKHQVKTDAELIAIRDDLFQKVNSILNLDDDLAFARKNLDLAKIEIAKSAKKLTETRLNIIGEFESKIGSLLADLGMPNAALKIEHKLIQESETGADQISFLFSANKGIAPQQLKMVASGGEFSRLMLAIKYILANKRMLPTIIFDEIDTGVSGEISIKVGKMMMEMAQKHQIIAITHLHQIAAQGKAHYYVYKDDSAEKTSSKIRPLTKEERIMEIAQMIGGANPTAGILDNAKAILEGYE